MRRTPARLLLVAAALIGGMAWLTQAGAADRATDDEFKALVEQDVKVITKAADAVDKAAAGKKKAVEKNAAAGIKSAAVNIAGYSNHRITGTDPAGDAKAAAIRDEAIKIYKAAEGKDFKAALELAKGLANAKPAADAKKIDVAKAFGELTQKEIMDNYKTTAQFGTNLEADIQANAKKKATAKPADAALMAYRVMVMGEYSKTVTKAENAADKKEWDDYNDKMMKVADELLAAAKKKSSAADMVKVFTTLDSTCTACHDKFK